VGNSRPPHALSWALCQRLGDPAALVRSTDRLAGARVFGAALLADEEWRTKSDRWIAETAHVSNRFVSNLRAEQTTVNGSQSEPPAPRTGKDGKTRAARPPLPRVPLLYPFRRDLRAFWGQPARPGGRQ
jgi:hypothetical protein